MSSFLFLSLYISTPKANSILIRQKWGDPESNYGIISGSIPDGLQEEGKQSKGRGVVSARNQVASCYSLRVEVEARHDHIDQLHKIASRPEA